VLIYYSVNGGTEKVIDAPYQGSNIITDVALSDVQYGSDISLQLSVQSNATTSGRSELLVTRMLNVIFTKRFLYFETEVVCFHKQGNKV